MKAYPYDFATMPTKRMAAGAIFLNASGNLLVVKPTYRPDWLIPGGTIEVGESPSPTLLVSSGVQGQRPCRSARCPRKNLFSFVLRRL